MSVIRIMLVINTVTTLIAHTIVHVTMGTGYRLMEEPVQVSELLKNSLIIILDINECAEHSSGCNQLCTNTIGSRTCSCYTGYQLSSNNRTCTGKGYWVDHNVYSVLWQTSMNVIQIMEVVEPHVLTLLVVIIVPVMMDMN